ncbi:uncharacterized protein METZ01_LOCUS49784 [marine metagenome]|uniref:Uncharacterized protein n=1 Tax=marine metagenome TaxID=408172 RepID=A0A381RYL6_9ZZZZ
MKWKTYLIRLTDLDQGTNLSDVTLLLFFRKDRGFDGMNIYINNIYYSK